MEDITSHFNRSVNLSGRNVVTTLHRKTPTLSSNAQVVHTMAKVSSGIDHYDRIGHSANPDEVANKGAVASTSKTHATSSSSKHHHRHAPSTLRHPSHPKLHSLAPKPVATTTTRSSSSKLSSSTSSSKASSKASSTTSSKPSSTASSKPSSAASPSSNNTHTLTPTVKHQRCVVRRHHADLHIQVPRYVLMEPKSSVSRPYHAYVVNVCVDATPLAESWTICKRYSEFGTLFTALKHAVHQAKENTSSQHPAVAVPEFPPKTIFCVHDHEFLSRRAELLGQWLQNVLNCFDAYPPHGKSKVVDFVAGGASDASRSSGAGSSPRSRSNSMILKKDSACILKEKDVNVVTTTSFAAEDAASESRSSPRSAKGGQFKDISNFKLLKVVGKGSFGKVLLASDASTSAAQPKQMYAIKVLEKEAMIKRKQVKRVKLERQCLEVVNSPFIVKLRGAFQSQTHLFIVQDYCAGGEMYYRLETLRTLPIPQAKFYIAECTLALEHLHSIGIIYRDMKPENIMIGADGHVRLVDFGLAKMGIKSSLEGARSFVGTTEYLSPEMILRKGHGFAVDWWALGMVLYEMIAGLPPWYSEDRKALTKGILKMPVSFKSSMDYHTRSLLGGLLEKNPKHRLGSWKGSTEVKNHPFLADMDWAQVELRQVKPPFVPNLDTPCDTKFFDKSFTSLAPTVVDKPAPASKKKTSTATSIFRALNFSSGNKDKKEEVAAFQEQQRTALASQCAFSGFSFDSGL